jgi:predicted DNA-binding protein (MmcQ/YjbR family)
MSRGAYRAARMIVRDRLRTFALSLPEATEDFPWGECVIRVNRKVFVFLGPETASGPRRATVKLDESNGHALSIEGAAPTGYGLGASGWVTVPLRAPGVSLDLLRDWVEESYRIVAPRRLVAELDASVTADLSSERAPGRSPRKARPA